MRSLSTQKGSKATKGLRRLVRLERGEGLLEGGDLVIPGLLAQEEVLHDEVAGGVELGEHVVQRLRLGLRALEVLDLADLGLLGLGLRLLLVDDGGLGGGDLSWKVR